MVAYRRTFATSALSVDTPPVPVSATVSAGTNVVVCTFDKPLQAGALDSLNWLIDSNHFGSQLLWLPMSPPIASGLTVTWPATPAGTGLGPNTIQYVPPPFDVIGLNLLPAAGFTGFPLTVIP